MASDFEKSMKELFGDSFAKLSEFQSGQMEKFMSRAKEIAREAIKEDLARLTQELMDLRQRVTVLEAERAAKAAEGLESSF